MNCQVVGIYKYLYCITVVQCGVETGCVFLWCLC